MHKIKSITYSDGDVESTILHLLERAPCLSSLSNIAQEHYASWPVRYHLSACRGNLLRPFDFSGLDVLEFGAGMGGVSRVIAESAKHLTIVEGTMQRYKAAQSRLRDLTNWDGQVCNIQDFVSDKQYDVICLVGVFEYSELYINQKNPHLWVLEHIQKNLKEDGVAIIALENKNGLKYFSGATEDHTGKHFDGICGYSKEKTIKTFSYHEMLSFFEESNFSHVSSYFPHPDYKMPRAILSSNMLSEEPKLAGQIMATYPSEDYMRQHCKFFPEALAWESLANSKLLHELANSFLFLATRTADTSILEHLLGKKTRRCLAWCYSTNREKPVQTLFYENQEHLETEKSYIETNENISLEPVIEGDFFLQTLLRTAWFEGKDKVISQLTSFFLWSFNFFAVKDEEYLLPEALDALPHNTIQIKDKYHFFDLEWKNEGLIPKSWYIYRSLSVLEENYYLFSRNDPMFSYKKYYYLFCSNCAVQPDYKKDVNREISFQHNVAGLSSLVPKTI